MRKFRKIFSCVLVIISFLLLFTSWTIITPSAQTAAVYSYKEAFDDAGEASSFSGVVTELRKKELSEYLGTASIFESSDNSELAYLKTDIHALLGAVTDGGMDITQTALAARTLNQIFRASKEIKTIFGSFQDTKLANAAGAFAAYNTIVTILFILAILAAIAAFLVRFLDRLQQFRRFDYVFIILQFLLFVMAVIFVGIINGASGLGYPVLGITLWGILAVIFACPSVLLDRIPFEKVQFYTSRSAAVNETASAFGGSVSKTMDKISSKMDETAQSVRLSRELKVREDLLRSKYVELGRSFYSANEQEPPEDLKDAFSEIAVLKEGVETIRKEIDVVNNVVACPNCQSRWPAGTKFCAECGGKLPSIAEDREEFDTEMKLKKEKKAGKSFCKYCGAKVEDDDDFCPGCGRSI